MCVEAGKATAIWFILTYPGHVVLRVLKSMLMATLISHPKSYGQCFCYVLFNVS